MSQRRDPKPEGPYRPGKSSGPYYDPWTGHRLSDGYSATYEPLYDPYTGVRLPRPERR